MGLVESVCDLVAPGLAVGLSGEWEDGCAVVVPDGGLDAIAIDEGPDEPFGDDGAVRLGQVGDLLGFESEAAHALDALVPDRVREVPVAPCVELVRRDLGVPGHRSHVLDDVIPELRALAQGRSFHQPLEVVGDGLGLDRALEALDDQVGGFLPAHVFEHEDA